MIGIRPEIRYSVLIGLLFAHLSFDASFAKAIEQSPTAAILDFGAKCDGATDDTRAIQAAIDTGRPVSLPIGVCSVSTLHISSPDTRIFGRGMMHSILKARGSGAAVSIDPGSGTDDFSDFSISGALVANYGIYCAPTACYQNKYSNIEVSQATGSPGVGIYNTSNCYAQEWRGMRVTNNNIGAAFSATCQGTSLYQSKFYFNLRRQLEVGDGAGYLRNFTISGCEIEGGSHAGATVYGIYVNQVDPLVVENSYFESPDSASSADIVVVAQSRIRISGVYSNANVVAEHAILLNTPTVDMSVEDSYYFNSTGTTITNLNTGNHNVFLRNVAMNLSGSTPSGRLFVSPANLGGAGDASANTAFYGSSIQSAISLIAPFLDEHAAGTSHAFAKFPSAGANYAALQAGSDRSNGGSWCWGKSTNGDNSTGAPLLCFDAAGNVWWGGPQSSQPIAGSRLYIENDGTIGVSFNDSSQSPGNRMWGFRTVDSGGGFQIASENDDGSIRNAGIQVNRSGTVAVANPTGASAEFAVRGGLQSYTSALFPVCDSTHRGEFFLQQGTPGMKDSVAVCAKDSAGAYAWRTIY
jgi:hypothetical protein